jgi:hypothetical protein
LDFTAFPLFLMFVKRQKSFRLFSRKVLLEEYEKD